MILMLLSLLTAEAKYYRLVTNIDELLTPGNTFIMVNSGYGEGLPYVARHFDGNRILTESSSLFSLPGIPGCVENAARVPMEFTFVKGESLSEQNLAEYYNGSYLLKAKCIENQVSVEYFIGPSDGANNSIARSLANNMVRDSKYKITATKDEDNIGFKISSLSSSVEYYLMKLFLLL